ncbi:MAG: ribonuclease J, partial [Bacilli bacterium]|nr:ribonuclease J [Bacilli bacterium]
MADKIKIFALGGLDEYGKNLYVLDINDDLFIIECGIKFPDKNSRGIDFIIADYSFLEENKERVKGIFVTHGHEDQMGGVGYLFTKAGINAPVYASDVTIAFMKRDMSRIGINPDIKYVQVHGGQTLQICNREFVFFDTCHSIMGSIGMAVWTDMGYIVYTGNYIVEYNSSNSKHRLDIVTLSSLASKGIVLLMTESEYSDEPGFTSPRHRLTPHIQKHFEDAAGRIFIALYDYDIYRLGEVIRLATQLRKKVILLGEQTNSIMDTLKGVNALSIPRNNEALVDDIFRVREQDIVIIIQAHRKSLFSMISSIANGDYEDKKIEIKPTDTFIFAAPPIIGIETVVVDTVDDVYRTGCNVVYLTNKNICDMHAHADDLTTLLSILRPKFYLPVAGEYRKLLANAKLAVYSDLGYSHANTFIL